jgi:hypothetical protein
LFPGLKAAMFVAREVRGLNRLRKKSPAGGEHPSGAEAPTHFADFIGPAKAVPLLQSAYCCSDFIGPAKAVPLLQSAYCCSDFIGTAKAVP